MPRVAVAEATRPGVTLAARVAVAAADTVRVAAPRVAVATALLLTVVGVAAAPDVGGGMGVSGAASPLHAASKSKKKSGRTRIGVRHDCERLFICSVLVAAVGRSGRSDADTPIQYGAYHTLASLGPSCQGIRWKS